MGFRVTNGRAFGANISVGEFSSVDGLDLSNKLNVEPWGVKGSIY